MIWRDYTIFYSWQSDSERSTNWDFIREALDQAAMTIRAKEGFDLPIVDAGMERIGGSPEVASIMFKKISGAAIFVGDVTLVGDIKKNGPTKRVPNPNVLMEMSFAGAVLGWNRVICVMNESAGKPDKLPVDIRNRRHPIGYRLSDANTSDSAAIRTTLAEDLRVAIEAVVYADYQAVIEAERRFDANCIDVVASSRFYPSFAPHRPPNPDGTQSAAERVLFAAIPRLLDLGLILCDYESGSGLYAYHWTYLGRMYIRKKWPNNLPDWIKDMDQVAAKGEAKRVVSELLSSRDTLTGTGEGS
jgi:hypothetical protein